MAKGNQSLLQGPALLTVPHLLLSWLPELRGAVGLNITHSNKAASLSPDNFYTAAIWPDIGKNSSLCPDTEMTKEQRPS